MCVTLILRLYRTRKLKGKACHWGRWYDVTAEFALIRRHTRAGCGQYPGHLSFPTAKMIQEPIFTEHKTRTSFLISQIELYTVLHFHWHALFHWIQQFESKVLLSWIKYIRNYLFVQKEKPLSENHNCNTCAEVMLALKKYVWC